METEGRKQVGKEEDMREKQVGKKKGGKENGRNNAQVEVWRGRLKRRKN